ncbi:chorismate mutase [Actinokineospora spheciospongiae]|uniref:chorismate mutase n=1 Tax=Actinokineospora spheciospongiae TaxID=909613 RepID=UPI000D70BB2F|nr:chorismate mutase [Actinokineospora spheciospongiae]PWW58259.1 isochorismate pyruvate lyase [Actinokineospora spheciospongiae]
MQISDPDALQALRGEIDELDRRIVALLARRTAVVRRVVQVKRDEAAVRSPDRVEQVVRRVRGLAEEHGTDPDVVESTYRALITALTDLQLRILPTRSTGGGASR